MTWDFSLYGFQSCSTWAWEAQGTGEKSVPKVKEVIGYLSVQSGSHLSLPRMDFVITVLKKHVNEPWGTILSFLLLQMDSPSIRECQTLST